MLRKGRVVHYLYFFVSYWSTPAFEPSPRLQPWSFLGNNRVGLNSKLLCSIILMQHMDGNIRYMFIYWADPVVYLLLLKSSLHQSMPASCPYSNPLPQGCGTTVDQATLDAEIANDGEEGCGNRTYKRAFKLFSYPGFADDETSHIKTDPLWCHWWCPWRHSYGTITAKLNLNCNLDWCRN